MEATLLPIIGVACVAVVLIVACLSLCLGAEKRRVAHLLTERQQISGYWDESIQDANTANVALGDALLEIERLRADQRDAAEQLGVLIDLNKETETRAQLLETQLLLDRTIIMDGDKTYICGQPAHNME